MKQLITIIVLFISISSMGQKVQTQCKGITVKGAQCKRMVDSVYCYQHVVKHDNSAKAKPEAINLREYQVDVTADSIYFYDRNKFRFALPLNEKFKKAIALDNQ